MEIEWPTASRCCWTAAFSPVGLGIWVGGMCLPIHIHQITRGPSNQAALQAHLFLSDTIISVLQTFPGAVSKWAWEGVGGSGEWYWVVTKETHVLFLVNEPPWTLFYREGGEIMTMISHSTATLFQYKWTRQFLLLVLSVLFNNTIIILFIINIPFSPQTHTFTLLVPTPLLGVVSPISV